MAFGKPKAPKAPKPPKAPKEKKPKAPKEKKPKKPKKEKPPKAKKGKKGQTAPEEAVEGLEGEEQAKKKKPIILLLIPVVVIAAAAAIIFFVVLPRMNADEEPEPSVSLEPLPPELPSEIPIGEDVNIAGMILGSDESGALVEKSKRVTYTYTNLVDAGKAAETYVGQLAKDSFSLVNEEFVRQSDAKPDYAADEGMVLLARNVAVKAPEATAAPVVESVEPAESLDPEASVEPTPTPTPEPVPEPTPEPVTYVHTVRIVWSPGVCVVTADEEVGKVTSPPSAATAQRSVSQRSARKCLEAMDPADLGLPGDSMDLYEVLPMDGAQMVDGVPAIRLHVYDDNSVAGSNDFKGCYLMTIDGEHLYRLDMDTNEITELEFEFIS